MKAKDVKYLMLASSWEEIVNLQAAMSQQDFDPLVGLPTSAYNDRYLDAADGNADGSLVQLTTWPFAEADENPAMTTYLGALKKAVPEAVPEQLGVQSWSAWLLWATAVKGLGSDVTRQGLAAALDNVHAWNGGGLHGTSDPGNNTPADCFIAMRVEGDAFVREFPTKEKDAEIYDQGSGFSCDPRYVVDLPTNRDNGAKANS